MDRSVYLRNDPNESETRIEFFCGDPPAPEKKKLSAPRLFFHHPFE